MTRVETASLTISEARRQLTQKFRAAGLARPDLDARVLVGHALGLNHTALSAAADRALNRDELERVMEFGARRLAREPVARIAGRKEFWGLEIGISPAVFVPRPETETVVEAALAWVDAGRLRDRKLRILDLCTGSGAILLALMSELPLAHGIGTDRSFAAVEVAGMNARRLGLAERAAFVVCDLAQGLPGGFDLVTANPPYIEASAIPTLEPEVHGHEPRAALDGGVDGLAAYRAIGADAARLISGSGRLVAEIGAGQAADVTAIFRAAGLQVMPPILDLAGTPRVIVATQ